MGRLIDWGLLNEAFYYQGFFAFSFGERAVREGDDEYFLLIDNIENSTMS
jgi:hypothetical protein